MKVMKWIRRVWFVANGDSRPEKPSWSAAAQAVLAQRPMAGISETAVCPLRRWQNTQSLIVAARQTSGQNV